jgi:hypothetical protein
MAIKLFIKKKELRTVITAKHPEKNVPSRGIWAHSPRTV